MITLNDYKKPLKPSIHQCYSDFMKYFICIIKVMPHCLLGSTCLYDNLINVTSLEASVHQCWGDFFKLRTEFVVRMLKVSISPRYK